MLTQIILVRDTVCTTGETLKAGSLAFRNNKKDVFEYHEGKYLQNLSLPITPRKTSPQEKGTARLPLVEDLRIAIENGCI